jgi:hypothetical protein
LFIDLTINALDPDNLWMFLMFDILLTNSTIILLHFLVTSLIPRQSSVRNPKFTVDDLCTVENPAEQ